jgi:hypothetical protein
VVEDRVKLRPDLQALVDAELERREQSRTEFYRKVAEGRAVDEYHGPPLAPVEPHFVPYESPLIDAINVARAVSARSGYREPSTLRGAPWPARVAFPRELVVAPEVDREHAERGYREADSVAVRETMLGTWRSAPWLAENYGGRLDFGPNTGFIVQRRARGDVVLGVAAAQDVKEYTDYSRRGTVEVDGVKYNVRVRWEENFEHDGKVYAVPVLEVTGKVRAKR